MHRHYSGFGKERLEISRQAFPKNSQWRHRHDVLQQSVLQLGSSDQKSSIADGWKTGTKHKGHKQTCVVCVYNIKPMRACVKYQYNELSPYFMYSVIIYSGFACLQTPYSWTRFLCFSILQQIVHYECQLRFKKVILNVSYFHTYIHIHTNWKM